MTISANRQTEKTQHKKDAPGVVMAGGVCVVTDCGQFLAKACYIPFYSTFMFY